MNMKNIIGISSIILVAGLVGVQAQNQTGAPPAPNPNPAGRVSSGNASPTSSRRPSIQPQDLGVYTDCYMKCINSGHPDDYCKTEQKNFCY
jgi:hypothetical protein